ncbi:MAG: retropepsin-like domain-containing protein [Acidobacteria bacterium]|nr:retropepsin-like domain-containing protein [Acidobacteriota bacterium]
MSKLILRIGLLILFSTLTRPLALATYVNDIPFAFENGFVVVEAKIKGDAPVHVVVATGSEYSIADTASLQKYELPVYYAPDGLMAGRNDKFYSYTKVSSVRTSDSKAKDVAMRLGSMGQISQMAGREVFAALGADFFEGQAVQIDFKNKVLRFLDKPAVDALKGKSAAANKILLQMAEKESNPFLRTFRVPLVTDVTFDGKKSKLLLDTGKPTHLALSLSVAKNVGFTLPAENDPPRDERVKSLRLGTSEMSDLPVIVYPKGSNAEKSISKYGAVAGSSFLKDFVVTFDFRSGLIVLERS